MLILKAGDKYLKNDNDEKTNNLVKKYIKITDDPDINPGFTELQIVTKIKDYKDKCKHIVNIIDINESEKFYICEKLTIIDNIEYLPEEERKKIYYDLKEARTFLRNLGIVYLDWKVNNIGIDLDGNIKLFDFDASGIFTLPDFKSPDYNIATWEPLYKPTYIHVMYNYALKMLNQFNCSSKTNPIQLDTFLFYNFVFNKLFLDPFKMIEEYKKINM